MAFAEKDAPFFFGRAAQQGMIIAALQSSHLTIIYGASGVGKSSLIGAGVVHGLNRLARVTADENGKQRFVVAVFSSWRDDPIAGLAECVREAILRAMHEFAIELSPASRSLVETFRAWSEQADCELYIILDQFEEYFLYKNGERGEVTFASEFPKLAKATNLRANILVSIRDDAYTKLGCFEDDIPNLFDNSIPVEHLNVEAARAAIEKPIEQYNRLYAAGRRRINIEPELVDAVIEQVKAGDVLPGESVADGREENGGVIEAPYLQLVMLRLWNEDVGGGRSTLSLSTLNRLSVNGSTGAENIVRDHLFSAIDKLQESEKGIAARVFYHLVTPYQTKIAYSVADLIELLSLDEKQVATEQQITEVLEKLSGGSSRIVRHIQPPRPGSPARYEIFHDVLCPAIIEWRRQYLRAAREREQIEEAERRIEEQRQLAERERQRAEEQALIAKLMRQRAVVLLILLVLCVAAAIAVGKWFSVKAKNEAARHRQELRDQYREDLQRGQTSDDLNEALGNALLTQFSREGVTQAIDSLKTKLKDYEENSNRAGVVTMLHNLGGFYLLLARQSGSKADYDEAEKYHSQALAEAREALGEDDPYLAIYLNDLATVYYEEAKFTDAESLLTQAAAIQEKTLALPDSLLLLVIENLATTYDTLGKYADAERLYDRALVIKAQSGDPLATAEGWTNLAGVYQEQARYDEAEAYYNKALGVVGATSEKSLPILRGLAQIYRKKQEFAKALSYSEQALNMSRSIGSPVDVALDKSYEAEIYSDQGEFAKAEPLFIDALKTLDAASGVDYVLSARANYGLGVLYYKQAKYREAEPRLKKALEIREQYQGNDHPDVADTLDVYSNLLKAMGREPEAVDMKARADAIRAARSR